MARFWKYFEGRLTRFANMGNERGREGEREREETQGSTAFGKDGQSGTWVLMYKV